MEYFETLCSDPEKVFSLYLITIFCVATVVSLGFWCLLDLFLSVAGDFFYRKELLKLRKKKIELEEMEAL